MDLLSLNANLRRGCDHLNLSFDVAVELISYLKIQSDNPQLRHLLSPSATLEKLLHWILLNTDARLRVEQSLGIIDYKTNTAKSEAGATCQLR